MVFREAQLTDIKQIQVVRNAVKENVLTNPALVTDDDCALYMTSRGKAWVCEINQKIVGFAYVDMQENNIWALFILPEYAERGIGKLLHKIMLDWYFSKTNINVWLGTSPNTRAAVFYERQGWKKTGMHGKEIKFEMTLENWLAKAGN